MNYGAASRIWNAQRKPDSDASDHLDAVISYLRSAEERLPGFIERNSFQEDKTAAGLGYYKAFVAMALEDLIWIRENEL